MLILLITENGSINNVLSKMAHVIWIKDVSKAMSLIDSEEYDDILVSEPFNKNKELLDFLDSKNLKYVLLNEVDDLKKYVLDKKAQKNQQNEEQPANTDNVEKKTYSQESVLLVTTNQKTIQELRRFNLTIATTPFSASQRIQEKTYRAVVWDLPAEPVKTPGLLYVWGRDLKNPEELDFVLRNGYLKVSNTNHTPEPTTKVVLVPETKHKEEEEYSPEINVEPIKNELNVLQRLKRPVENIENTGIAKPQKKALLPLKKSKTETNIEQQKVSSLPEKHNLPKVRASIFTKTGVIVNNRFIKVKFDNPNEIDFEYDALVITSSMGLSCVKEYRRQNPLRPVVVLGGDKSFLDVGADKCVKRINKQVIEEMTHLNERIKKLWMQMETDSLTGVYTRAFFEKWKEDRESRGKGYSIVLIDIDKFKVVNDTYGHDAGDLVLHQFAQFLKDSVRDQDLVVRWGGEEFVVCLPDTGIQDGYKLIDRLRLKWGERRITLKDGREISCTFSAGIAEWPNSWEVLEEADKKLYEAKNKGRNQVCISSGLRILTLGLPLNDNRVQATFDPNEAVAVISNATNAKHAPAGMPLYIVLSGQIGDWVAKQNNPDAVFCNSVTEAVNLILKPKITVLPGARGNDKGMTIPHHGALYIVSPSRPALAGEIAAALCEETPNCALVCASPESMGAVSLGIPTKTLVTSDWRFPGAEAPLDWNGIKVWPVDPYKYTDTRSDPKSVVDQIKSHFSLVIIDCASSLDLCARVARNEGILVLTREGDASDQITQQWLKTYGGINVTVVNPTEMPLLKEVENGFILSRTSSLVQNF